MITYTFNYPPSVNHYWNERVRKIKGKFRVVKTKGQKGHDYMKHVALVCNNHMTLSGRIKVAILAYPPDKRKRDIDNIVKPVLDAMEQAGVYENDSQIDELLVKRMSNDQHKDFIDVIIEEL